MSSPTSQQPATWAAWDLTIYQGADWSQPLTWQDPTGTPIELTGWQAHAQVRTNDDLRLLVDLVSTGSPDPTAVATGTITLGGTAGTILLAMAAEETAKVDPTVTALWDLFLVDAAGDEQPLLRGRVTIIARVTGAS